MKATSRRSGFTVIELLVSIAVIALLLAILVPAVQQVRESGRRMQCRNHLKQIGIAVENYSSVHGMFPPGQSNEFSLHVFLLPHLDQADLYEQVDFESGATHTHDDYIASHYLEVFHCPSDGIGHDATPFALIHGTNYAGNYGSGVQRYGYNGVFRNLYSGRLMFGKGGPVRPAHITDGLSNTASISEILIANDGGPDEWRTIWPVPKPYYVGGALLDEFADGCENLQPGPVPQPDTISRGRRWTWGDTYSTLYNHVLPPNRRSCKNSGIDDGIYTAMSNHTGGVHVLYCDGHVEFASSSIDRGVWRAIGSRNGGEAIVPP